ncbi:uncharacterized protein LOC123673581 [Harmonia axyridis]|uniref:uncharacterized protein LOC123673581 n=1 Tax=Harmonia axyridis TaxID=115357 RepID=UPI001E275338|nr:uncharacterized protein LOC123673581 [Harmonia axyridis]
MKAVLIISSLLLTFALGDVVTSSYGTYLQTPQAITKMARSDSGYSYSVTSTRGHPSSFLYGVQQIGAPLALTYSSIGASPLSYLAHNILPYDYTTKNFIPKIVIPYSTLAFSPLVSQLSSIYQTSSIPSLLQDDKKMEGAMKPATIEQPSMMMDQRPMMPQNPFFASFGQNGGVPQQNPSVQSDPSIPALQGNNVDDDTVSVESA